MISTAFFGSPEAAVPTLSRLEADTDLRTVVTMPPRPKGRGKVLTPTPVEEHAVDLGLSVLHCSRKSELADLDLDVDVAVVVAYGAIIPPELLSRPRAGFVNLHFSLLPRWRGAAPVERSILAGDEPVGVTLMAMDEGLDTGPIIATMETQAGAMDAGELTAVLAELGTDLLALRLGDWVAGDLAATPQPDGATYAPKLEKREGYLDPTEPAEALARRVRAMTPRPGAFLETNHGRLGVAGATAVPTVLVGGTLEQVPEGVLLGTNDGSLLFTSAQPPGKRMMKATDWANGRRGDLGEAT